MRLFIRTRNHYAGKLLLLGFGVVILYNWRLWQQDKALLAEKKLPEPLLPLEAWPSLPLISVLVAAWNEEGNIQEFLVSFTKLCYPNKQLVLCAGGFDGTWEIAAKFTDPSITLIKQERGEGKQQALNRCSLQADGEIIMLVDADCRLADESFQRLIYPLITQETSVVTGVSQPLDKQRQNKIVQYQSINDLVWVGHMPRFVDGVLGRNCALRREALQDIGGFNDRVSTGTDYYMSRLLINHGYSILGVPDSRIMTEYPDTIQSYIRMWRRWNKNLLIHGFRFLVWKDIKGVLFAAALAISIFTIPLFAILFGPFVTSSLMLLFATANLNRLRRLLTGIQRSHNMPSLGFFLMIPLFTLMDMTAVLLAVYDVIRPNSRSTW